MIPGLYIRLKTLLLGLMEVHFGIIKDIAKIIKLNWKLYFIPFFLKSPKAKQNWIE